MTMKSINWYPGHMKKTKDMIKDNMKIVDIVLEIVDARIPLSSKNPEIETFSNNKKRIILLNKADLVDKVEIEKWKNYFISKNMADAVLEISAITGFNMKKIYTLVDKFMAEKREKMFKKGLKKVSVRLLIVGIPNVGKSKLINKIVGRPAAVVGNRPGVTRGKQWIKIKDGIELLDTPGILWPKFENEEVGLNLAITGSIKDEILDMQYVASNLIIKMIALNKKNILREKYKLKDEDFLLHPDLILEKIGENLRMILKGGKINIFQVSNLVVRDYRACKLGKFVLDIEK